MIWRPRSSSPLARMTLVPAVYYTQPTPSPLPLSFIPLFAHLFFLFIHFSIQRKCMLRYREDFQRFILLLEGDRKGQLPQKNSKLPWRHICKYCTALEFIRVGSVAVSFFSCGVFECSLSYQFSEERRKGNVDDFKRLLQGEVRWASGSTISYEAGSMRSVKRYQSNEFPSIASVLYIECWVLTKERVSQRLYLTGIPQAEGGTDGLTRRHDVSEFERYYDFGLPYSILEFASSTWLIRALAFSGVLRQA